MAGELVLITGISGFIGFAVLRSTLEHGYRVRGAVRREAQITQIRSVPALKPYLDNLEIVVVPDIIKEGAFDNAVKDVTYILHVASPLSNRATDDYYTSLIVPAVQGTLGMLRSAAKSPTVKRVVITSSMAVLSIFPGPADGRAIKVTEHFTPMDPHTKFPDPFVAYGASKQIAYAASQEFMKTTKPNFDLISIFPSVVLGPSPLVTKAEDYETGTNRYVIALLKGLRVDKPNFGATVHVGDVALAHVKALDPKVEGNQDFILSASEDVKYDDAIEIVKKWFPDAEKKLSLDGHLAQGTLRFDLEATEKVLGIKGRGFEDQVRGLVGHYLELLG